MVNDNNFTKESGAQRLKGQNIPGVTPLYNLFISRKQNRITLHRLQIDNKEEQGVSDLIRT